MIGRQKETWHRLDAGEIRKVAEYAQARGPGRYTLREICGDQWQFERRPRRFGRLFRQAVEAFRVPGIKLIGRKSNKSLVYEVIEILKAAA